MRTCPTRECFVEFTPSLKKILCAYPSHNTTTSTHADSCPKFLRLTTLVSTSCSHQLMLGATRFTLLDLRQSQMPPGRSCKKAGIIIPAELEHQLIPGPVRGVYLSGFEADRVNISSVGLAAQNDTRASVLGIMHNIHCLVRASSKTPPEMIQSHPYMLLFAGCRDFRN